ncbi:hypothetical protein ABW19_dt0200740 [Dactylella cylindrospora]|nr:hypothetical protein ABW19_dt0200740 [Dactylella cylindrospora]
MSNQAGPSSEMEVDSTQNNILKRPYSPEADSPASPLDLGLPEILSPAKRAALTHPDDSTPTRRVTRQSAAHAANEPTEKRQDPFFVLPDNVVRMIMFLLPNKTIVALRRVSRFWKGNVEFWVTEGFNEKAYGKRAITETLKAEGKLGWPEFAFRKNTFLEEARINGAPTSVKKFTNAQIWDLVGERLVWIDESSNLNVQHLSAWDFNERKDSLVALAGNPRALAKNKSLHSVVAVEQRQATAERPKRASKKEKIPEPIIIRWYLRDTLKNRRTKLKVNFMVPYGSSHIFLDYYQYDDSYAAFERVTNRIWPQVNSRNKLACINLLTGYAEWNINLEDTRLAFPASHGLYLRPRYNAGVTSYLIHNDVAYSFTNPDRRYPFGPPGDKKIFLTARDCKTGTVIESKEIKEISDVMNDHHYPNPEHSILSPDGKTIVLSISRKLWICNAPACEFVAKIEMPWLQYSIVGARFDLEFSDDGNRVYLTEECNGHDFNVLELDVNNGFKPVFIRCYHVPNKNSFVSRTNFNHRLHTQVLTTRNASQPMASEWRPEMLKFISMSELMEGVPRDLWAAEWRSKLPNVYSEETWSWGGPSATAIPPIPVASLGHPNQILVQLSQLTGPSTNGVTGSLTALGITPSQFFGNLPGDADHTTITPRGKVFLETPRKDYVMISRSPITLPPLSKIQPNAIQEPADETIAPGEYRPGGSYYTGPPPTKRKGKKSPKKSITKLDDAKMNERREWWIGGRMSPFKFKNGERFIVFDQEDAVYCCDFGPVGW